MASPQVTEPGDHQQRNALPLVGRILQDPLVVALLRLLRSAILLAAFLGTERLLLTLAERALHASNDADDSFVASLLDTVHVISAMAVFFFVCIL